VERFNFSHVHFVSWRLPVPEWASLSRDLGKISAIILLNVLHIFWLVPLLPLWCPWFTGLVFWWRSSSCVFLLQPLSLLAKNSSVFFNIYFVFEPWNSVFHLFQSTGVTSNIFLFDLRHFLIPGILFDFFFWTFHMFVKLLFHILFNLLYFIYLFFL
jgi:hypothetical protein